MAPNQRIRTHSAHALQVGSSRPTVACPFCPRHFRNRRGRTKHIGVHHRDEPYMPNMDADVDMDTASRLVDRIPEMTIAYHPKLDGKVDFFSGYAPTLRLHVGQICDESGNNIPLDTPPPPRGSDNGSDDWTPYDNRIQFRLADFLIRRNQMSTEHINILLGIWAESLAKHDDEPPFSNATHLYDTVDSTPLGDVSWESFVLQYNGPRPVENIPQWMEAEYDVWFRDPRTLVHKFLSNPDFRFGFDYEPYQMRTNAGVHRFQEFMSGNWAWNQAVGLQYSIGGQVLIYNVRILSLRIPKPMARFFALLSSVPTKQLYLFLETMSTGPSIYLSVTYTTVSGENIAMVLRSLASSLSRNVSVVSYCLISVNVWVSFSNS